ncbi:MAG TPA: tetratricopeptide repeat protein [Bryobacteraceae bacterium]|nr:tetratricopeptide repeat protein [Bryobacteraceae bacterium]
MARTPFPVAFRPILELAVSSKYARVIFAAAAFTVVIAGAGKWRHAVSAQAAGAYADPAVCAQCHPSIAATYKKTGMGRSFRKVRSEKDLDVPGSSSSLGKPFYHAASNSFFNMIFRNGAWYQRRWETGFDGKETNIDEKRVDYVMGSGNHSQTLLHLTERNTLQELPLGWYAEKGGFWGMNPGYDRADYSGSVRPIFYECMFCHNGYPKIPEGAQHDTAQTTYLQPLPEGIDCQRCHGPGQDHVDKASHGAAAPVVRAAIVNPARLNPDREMEVCLQCHLETSNQKLPHAVVRLDRGPFSYVPGEPLGDFEVAFDRVAGKNTGFEVAQAGYRFRESQCFLKSGGLNGESKLRCTTCHNPHDIRHDEQATAHYNQVCQSCHQITALTPAPAAHKTTAADCVSCHMPKRRTDDGVHVVMTDHFIQRRPPSGDLLADKAERVESQATSYQGEVELYYPSKLPSTADNDLTVAVAQVRDQSNLRNGVPLLRAQITKYHPTRPGYYAELAEAYNSIGDSASAIRSFEEASQLDTGSAQRLIQWGDALMRVREWTQAESKLRRATEIAPKDPRAWGRLGWDLWQQDKATEAKSALGKAISLDAEVADLHNDFGLILWGTGNQAQGEAEFREAIRIQPGVAEWRLNFGKVLAGESKIPEALFQMEQSVRFKPDDVDARIGYAGLLSDTNQPREAEAQAKAAVASDPKRADAHEVLGDLLARRGDLNAAAPELQEAVRLQPGFGRAQFELGMVLGGKGDAAGAREHLNIAAQSSDPQASAAARQALQRSGR